MLSIKARSWLTTDVYKRQVGFLHAQFIDAPEYRDALRMGRDEREHGNFVNE